MIKIIGLIVAFGFSLAVVGCTDISSTEEETKLREVAVQGESKEEEVEKQEEVKEEEKPVVVDDKILTIDNDEAFRKIMTVSSSTEEHVAYFKSIVGTSIKFNGSINYVGYRPKYKTRLEMHMSYGDYNDENVVAPSFFDKDVPQYGGKFDVIPTTGDNVIIRARVNGYDKDRDCILLTIESIMPR